MGRLNGLMVEERPSKGDLSNICTHTHTQSWHTFLFGLALSQAWPMCWEYQDKAVLEMLNVAWLWHLKQMIIISLTKEMFEMKKEMEQNYIVLIWNMNYDKLLKYFVFKQFTPKFWIGHYGMQTLMLGNNHQSLHPGDFSTMSHKLFGQLSVFSPPTFHLAEKAQGLDQRRGIWR